jgi:hypothetical protein
MTIKLLRQIPGTNSRVMLDYECSKGDESGDYFVNARTTPTVFIYSEDELVEEMAKSKVYQTEERIPLTQEDHDHLMARLDTWVEQA